MQALKLLKQGEHQSKLLQVANTAAMQARRMLREADANGDGLVSKHEFVGLLSETNVPDGLGKQPNSCFWQNLPVSLAGRRGVSRALLLSLAAWVDCSLSAGQYDARLKHEAEERKALSPTPR